MSCWLVVKLELVHVAQMKDSYSRAPAPSHGGHCVRQRRSKKLTNFLKALCNFKNYDMILTTLYLIHLRILRNLILRTLIYWGPMRSKMLNILRISPDVRVGRAFICCYYLSLSIKSLVYLLILFYLLVVLCYFIFICRSMVLCD